MILLNPGQTPQPTMLGRAAYALDTISRKVDNGATRVELDQRTPPNLLYYMPSIISCHC
jgi:hypothetical protein